MEQYFLEILKSYQGSPFEIILRGVQQESYSVNVRNGKMDDLSDVTDSGVMINVVRDQKVYRVGLCSFERDAIDRGIKNALGKWERYQEWLMPTYIYPHLEDKNFHKDLIQSVDLSEQRTHFAENLQQETEKLKKDAVISNALAYLSLCSKKTFLCSNTGATQTDEQVFNDLSFRLQAGIKGANQIRSNGYETNQGHLTDQYSSELSLKSNLLLEELKELVAAPNCPNEKMDVILTPHQMYIQIHESIGHPLELDRILGDERNYAGGSFVKPTDFNQLIYGSELLNINYQPHVETEVASLSFDDCGEISKEVELIKNGKLLAGIGGMESQTRLGVNGTASCRASSWNRPPIDRMGNINLLSGTESLDDLVKKVEKGIMMFTNRSWSIDDQRDKFQFGCEYARLIENGEVTKVVKNPNYRGRTIPFWKSLSGVGDQSTLQIIGTPTCGKGEPNQPVRVGHASPACLFHNIDCFSGE